MSALPSKQLFSKLEESPFNTDGIPKKPATGNIDVSHLVIPIQLLKFTTGAAAAVAHAVVCQQA